MRLFTGFSIDARPELLVVVKKLKIGADRRDMEFNWIPVANYHVTLNFIGEVEENNVSIITNLMAEVAIRHAPFSTTLQGLGAFPDAHHMRTIFSGVRNRRELRAVQEDLREQLVSAGFAQEEREYVPHLTLAKTRKARSGVDLLSPFVRHRFGEVVVDRLVLFESKQHGPHSSYHVLDAFRLTGLPPSEDEQTSG